MAKVRISFSKTKQEFVRDIDKKLRLSVTQDTLNRAGELMIQKIQGFVGRGISPIEGQGTYPKYRGTYRDRIDAGKKIKGSDGGFYTKRKTPVNLEVSGKFREALKHKVNANKDITLFFEGNDKRGTPYKDYEKGHRKGVNGQAKRPMLPGKGQKLKKSVLDVYVSLIKDAVRRRFI